MARVRFGAHTQLLRSMHGSEYSSKACRKGMASYHLKNTMGLCGGRPPAVLVSKPGCLGFGPAPSVPNQLSSPPPHTLVLQDAFHNGAREKLIYVPCIVPDQDRPDYLATVDVDPDSADYGKVGRQREKQGGSG